MPAIERFRCGNEERWNRYWRLIEERVYVECGRGRHDVEACDGHTKYTWTRDAAARVREWS